MLEINNLVAGYGERRVLSGISLTLENGELTSVIGPNGSGKSTLGVLLAKAIGYSFVDTDLIISRRAGKPLQGRCQVGA